MSTPKFLVLTALVAAMLLAAAAFSFHTGIAAYRKSSAVEPHVLHASKPQAAQASSLDVLDSGMSWQRWPSTTDF